MGAAPRVARLKKERLLRPIHPNLGIQIEYQRRLSSLIKEMSESTVYWLRASYRANQPIALDETPADALKRSIRQLSKRWQKKFDEAGPKLAAWFAKASDKRSADALRKILKDAGLTVAFKMTPAMRDVFNATLNQNVALIKSIPAQYFVEIEGMVMRSVQTGRDLGMLTKELQDRYGVTYRRAALIARTQNNLATSSMVRARQIEVGFEEAIWTHSGGGHEPRPTHLKAGREKTRYKIAEGWFDPDVGEHILPGQLINCRCVGRPVIKGFS